MYILFIIIGLLFNICFCKAPPQYINKKNAFFLYMTFREKISLNVTIKKAADCDQSTAFDFYFEGISYCLISIL